jgi:hypothetical protein
VVLSQCLLDFAFSDARSPNVPQNDPARSQSQVPGPANGNATDNAVNSADADTVPADGNNDHPADGPAISDDEVPGPANGNALNNSTTEGDTGATLIDSDVDGHASSQAADFTPSSQRRGQC